MKQDFEDIMRRKMEEGDVQDIHPGFDKDLAWLEIESRIPQKKRKIFALGWSHAAALLVGVMVSSLVIMLTTNKQDDVNTVVISHTDTLINTVTERDTITVQYPQQVIVKTPVQKPDTQMIQKPVSTSAPILQPVEKRIAKEEAEIAPEPIEATPVVAKKKVTVVHLLDIENEDRNTALYHNDPSAAQRSGFAFQISTKRLPENRNSEQSSVLINLIKR